MRPPRQLIAIGGAVALVALGGCATGPSPCDVASDVSDAMEERYDALPDPGQGTYAMALVAIGASMSDEIDDALERTDDPGLVAALASAQASAAALTDAGEEYENGDAAGFLQISGASDDLRTAVSEAYVAGCAATDG